MRAAKIRAARPGAAPAYMASTAAELRRQTAGIGIDVLSLGNGVLIRIPADADLRIRAAPTIAPQIRATLHELARTLKTAAANLSSTSMRHTDTTGTPADQQGAVGQARRPRSPPSCRPTAWPRRGSRRAGYGESAPLYLPDDNEMKRAANRRVEIRLVPFTGLAPLGEEGRAAGAAASSSPIPPSTSGR